MVDSTVCGEPQPIYKVLYTIGDRNKGYFYPNMSSCIIFGLAHCHLSLDKVQFLTMICNLPLCVSYFRLFCRAVCILVLQRLNVMPKKLK
jgi:hypothetical protein